MGGFRRMIGLLGWVGEVVAVAGSWALHRRAGHEHRTV